MSTLKVTNIQSNGAGFNDVVSFQNASGTQNGTLCRTWVNFNGTGTVAIRDSFNVSSITDNGTGDYTVNFATAMPDANYCAVATCCNQSGLSVAGSVNILGSVNKVASSVRVRTFRDDTAATFDNTDVNVSIFR
jgi:hypothetical protein